MLRWQFSKHMAFGSDGVTETAFAFQRELLDLTSFTFQKKGVLARLREYITTYTRLFFFRGLYINEAVVFDSLFFFSLSP